MLPWESVFAGTYILPPDDKTVKRDSFEEKKRGGGLTRRQPEQDRAERLLGICRHLSVTSIQANSRIEYIGAR